MIETNTKFVIDSELVNDDAHKLYVEYQRTIDQMREQFNKSIEPLLKEMSNLHAIGTRQRILSIPFPTSPERE